MAEEHYKPSIPSKQENASERLPSPAQQKAKTDNQLRVGSFLCSMLGLAIFVLLLIVPGYEQVAEKYNKFILPVLTMLLGYSFNRA